MRLLLKSPEVLEAWRAAEGLKFPERPESSEVGFWRFLEALTQALEALEAPGGL